MENLTHGFREMKSKSDPELMLRIKSQLEKDNYVFGFLVDFKRGFAAKQAFPRQSLPVTKNLSLITRDFNWLLTYFYCYTSVLFTFQSLLFTSRKPVPYSQ